MTHQNNFSDPFFLWEKTCRSRGYLTLCADIDLLRFFHFLADGNLDSALAIRVAAELAIRAHLQNKPDLFPPPPNGHHIFSLEDHRQIVTLLKSGHLPSLDLSCKKLNHHIQHGLDRWQRADGFLPLVIQGNHDHDIPQAIAVPFYVKNNQDHISHTVVCEFDGASIPGLQSAWDDACEAAVKSGLLPPTAYRQCVFHDLSIEEAHLLKGRSAIAPFFIALTLHQLHIDIPAMLWFASGDIDPISFHVIKPTPGDDEWAAKNRLAIQFAAQPELQLLPQNWPETTPSEWKNTARLLFTAHSPSQDIDSIEHNLKIADDHIHHGVHDHSDTKRKLDAYLYEWEKQTKLSPRNLRAKVYCQRLLASIACHQGNPSKCIQILRSKKLKTDRESCLTLIRLAVSEADMALFQESEENLNHAIELADQLDELDQMIIKRDALGSKGLMLIAKALETENKSDETDALKALNDTLDLTKILDADQPNGQLADEARNLCYLFLWHAYFMPATEATGHSFNRALEMAKQTETTQAYILRAAHLARYRAIITENSPALPWWPSTELSLPKQDATENWVVATSLKYKATYLAHQGNVEEALNTFDAATSILNDPSFPLLQLIHGTILLQAGQSLRKTNPTSADHYLSNAERCFSNKKLTHVINPQSCVSLPSWLNATQKFIEHTSQTGTSPQLRFQY